MRLASLTLINAALKLVVTAQPADINVAVAAKFTEPTKEIVAIVKRTPGHEAALSFGANGQCYSQITQARSF
ncbi:hypothetical protein ACFIOY_19580 [Bradyrhizobium sp. TZ2]